MMNIVEIGNREFTNLTDIYAYIKGIEAIYSINY